MEANCPYCKAPLRESTNTCDMYECGTKIYHIYPLEPHITYTEMSWSCKEIQKLQDELEVEKLKGGYYK